MDIRRIIRKIRADFDILAGRAKYSYSQFGEDIIIDSLFNTSLKNTSPSYLDIGTNSPTVGNNTYGFYLKKCKGVCVEPDTATYNKIISKRPNDTVLNMGVGLNGSKSGILYIFPEPYTGWNTFSKEEALLKKNQSGIPFKESKEIPFVTINEIIEKHFESCPDFVSIDVEGLDFEIIKSLDFEKYKPAVFCIETMEFNNLNLGKKNEEMISYLLEKGYMVYADTYVNTIFVRKDLLNI